ncbi:MAG: ECF-type sigma factor [Thermoanaerobaculia bacterium]
MEPAAETITQWLAESRQGDVAARERLLEAVYLELKRSAHRELDRFRGFETLDTTAVVHEVFLRLLSGQRLEFENRIHLLSVAAIAMRRMLIDRARERSAAKRGSGQRAVGLDQVAELAADRASDELLAVNAALERLEALDERLARVVELRFFGGLTEPEIASALEISERTARRDWTKARAFLHREILAAR